MLSPLVSARSLPYVYTTRPAVLNSLKNRQNELSRLAVIGKVHSNSITLPYSKAFGTSIRAYQNPRSSNIPPNSSESDGEKTQPPPTKEQPQVEAFDGPSQPRRYYERPQLRELPRASRKWPVLLGVAVLGLASWAAFLTYATNQEKISSSVFRSICRSVRRDPAVKEVLGEAVRPQPEWWLNGDPFVKGQIGQLQGNIDVCFRVKGSKGAGTVYFTSIRTEKGMPFTTLRFKVIADDGTVLTIQT